MHYNFNPYKSNHFKIYCSLHGYIYKENKLKYFFVRFNYNPSEVFLSKKNEVWFKCAVSNTNWLDYHDRLFTISEPCDFIQKYIGDIELRQKYDTYNKAVEKIPKIWNVGRCWNLLPKHTIHCV